MRHTLLEILTGLRRNFSMTLAVIVTMWVSLTLFGMSVLAAQQVDLIKGRWYDKIEITVFLCAKDSSGPTCTPGKPITGDQLQAVRSALEANPEVAQVFYESPADVFAEFKEVYKGSPILESVVAEDMQGVFRIKLKDPQQYEGIRTSVTGMPGVQAIQDLRAYLEPLFIWLNGAKWAALGASALLLVAAALQISNAIRMAAFNRRQELGIMRLVGASNWYIMLPFLGEALIAALTGALLATGTMMAFQEFVIVAKAKPLIQTVRWIDWPNVSIAVFWVVVVAVVLSIIPTVIAARRHLRV